MSQAPMTASGKSFLRDATGLVREISFFDAFLFNLFWLNIGLGIGITFSFAPAAFPGSNIILGVAIATVFSMVNVLMYGLFSAAIQRSDGDYVMVSRVLHPALGFVVSWASVWGNAFIIVLGTYLFIGDGLSPALTSIGLLLGNDALLNAAFVVFNPTPSLLIGGAAIILFGILMATGSRNFFSLQKVMFVLGMIAVVLALILFATSSRTEFISALEAVEGQGVYQATIDAARASGLVEGAPSFTALLGAIGVALFTMPWGYASLAIGGEVREAHRTQPLAMTLAVATTGIVIIISGLLITRVVGQDFLAATGYLFNIGDYNNLPLGAPYFNFFASVLTTNPIIIILIAVGFIAWTFMWIPINILTNSRRIFAWAFDRVVPERLGEVSERFHTPVLTIALTTFAALLFWALWVFTGAFFLTSFMIMGMVGILVSSVAAVVFPYRRKAMYEGSTIAGYKLFGLPLISVLGVINFLFFSVIIVFASTNADFGANSPAAWITFAAVWATGFIVFFASKAIRRSQDNIDLDLVYQEIPPE
jgi:amino acid transporter